MKANELRIGNYAKGPFDETVTLKSIYKEGTPGWQDGEGITYGPMRPIPLTEEWLKRLGFKLGKYNELNEKHYVEDSNAIKVIVSGIGFWDIYTDYSPIPKWNKQLNVITDNRGIKYVHQLQNLYFALTGEELKIIQK